MKKNYMSPCISLLDVEEDEIIATSTNIGGDVDIPFGGDDNEGYEGE